MLDVLTSIFMHIVTSLEVAKFYFFKTFTCALYREKGNGDCNKIIALTKLCNSCLKAIVIMIIGY